MRIGLNRYFFMLFYALAQFVNTVNAPQVCVSIPFPVIYTFNSKIFSKSFRIWAQLQNTRPLIYISLNKNSNYCYIPRSLKDTDTCK